MKKFICLLLCIVSLVAFTACSNNSSDINSLKDEIASLKDGNKSLKGELDSLKEIEQSKLPDFEDCEIGYQLEVYPKVAFDYKVSEDCVVHIESISATLTAKNVINEGDMLTESFYPYFITLTAQGTTTSSMMNSTMWISLNFSNSVSQEIRCEINSEGKFSSSRQIGLIGNTLTHFIRINTL